MNGAIFCQVKISTHWNQEEAFMTCGNQKWKGGIPAFNSKVRKITPFIVSIKLENE